MRRIDILAETPMVFVLEMFPQTFPVFQQIGVCCITEENMNATVGEVCKKGGVDAASFIAVLKEITIGGGNT